MLIVILAHALRSGGGAVVGRNFVNALNSITNQRHKYIVTIPGKCGYENITLPDGGRYVTCGDPGSKVARIRFEKEIKRNVVEKEADVVLGLGNHGLTHVRCPQAVFVQNAYLVYPSDYFPGADLKKRMQIKLQRHLLKKVLKSTELLFCQTPVMKKRLSEYYGYDSENIKLLPNAVSGMLTKSPCRQSQEKAKGVKKDKFNCLVLSKYYVHKNPGIIVEAIKQCPERFDDFNFITTVSPNDNKQAKRFLEQISEDEDVKGKIENVGFIEHENLAEYYSDVQLVIMPTLLESFSVTYLEAMYFGVPVLTTDLDFAHYICGPAAAYYDPWSAKGFAERLLEVYGNKNMQNELVQAGKLQFQKFDHSWEDVVVSTVNELEKIARP